MIIKIDFIIRTRIINLFIICLIPFIQILKVIRVTKIANLFVFIQFNFIYLLDILFKIMFL
jgi:hypothetical protein